MGKLNIAHHKSYHPYRRDNIERVRRDEEEARQREAVEEGRMMLAVGLPSSPSPSFPHVPVHILRLPLLLCVTVFLLCSVTRSLAQLCGELT